LRGTLRTSQHLKQACLARTRRANDGDLRTHAKLQANALQSRWGMRRCRGVAGLEARKLDVQEQVTRLLQQACAASSRL